MTNADLVTAVRSFADEVLSLSAGLEAARANLVCYDVRPEDVETAALAGALHDVADRLSQRLAGEASPLTFYAWYDEQAGQVRCSLARVTTTDLPFGGPYRSVDDPGPVLARMAADRNPGFVAWSDLEAVPFTADPRGVGPDDHYWFPVYAVGVVSGPLPRSRATGSGQSCHTTTARPRIAAPE